jgi:SAM-dependent methyltransferase
MNETKMRTENISRLSGTELKKTDFYYLHYKSFHRDLKSSIERYAKGRVLDIGCGNKPYEKVFEGRCTEYVGCDIVQSSLQKVDILCEANNIPLEPESFDTTFSTQTIEHVADHQGLVNEAYRLTKPGGHFILSGPLYWHLHEEPYDFFRFTRYGFDYILKKAGFEVVEILSNGGAWALSGQSLLHAFTNSRSNHFFIKTCRYLFFRLRLYWLTNSFFGWLDKVDYEPVNTMNYVVIAKK